MNSKAQAQETRGGVVMRVSRASWSVHSLQGELVVRLFDWSGSSAASRKEEELTQGGLRLQGSLLDMQADTRDFALVYDERPREIALAPLQLVEQSEYLLEVEVKGPAESERSWKPSLRCFPALGYPILRLEPRRHKRRLFAGRLNFRDFVGSVRLEIEEDGQVLCSFLVEVRSRKLGYLDEYVALLDALVGHAAGLVLRMESPVHAHFMADGQGVGGVVERFLLLRHLLRGDRLVGALKQIAREPQQTRQWEVRETALGRALPNSAREIAAGVRRARAFVPVPKHVQLPGAPAGLLPSHVPKRVASLGMNNAHNAFVLAFLERVFRVLGHLGEVFADREQWGHVLEVKRLQEMVEDWECLLPFSRAEVGRMEGRPLRRELSHLPGYRELVGFWDELELTLRLEWHLLAQALLGPLRDLARLYEIWCFFALLEALGRVAQPLDEGWVWREEGERLCVELPQGESQGACFRYKELHIRLQYQRRFVPGQGRHASYSVAYTPDYTLALTRPGKPVCFVCFDAKYRASGGLEKMHAYRDALRGVLGAYLLYPGEQEEPSLFHLHPERPFPGVGGFSLRPGSQMRLWLSSFLEWIFEHLSQEDSPSWESQSS